MSAGASQSRVYLFGRGDAEVVAVDRGEAARPQPGVESGRGRSRARVRSGARGPTKSQAFLAPWHQRRGELHTELSTGVDNRGAVAAVLGLRRGKTGHEAPGRRPLIRLGQRWTNERFVSAPPRDRAPGHSGRMWCSGAREATRTIARERARKRVARLDLRRGRSVDYVGSTTERGVVHEEDISAECAAPEEDARIPRADEDPGRAEGAQASAREGAQAADGLRERGAASPGVLTLPRVERLRRPAEFQAVFRAREPAGAADSFIALWRPRRAGRGRASRSAAGSAEPSSAIGRGGGCARRTGRCARRQSAEVELVFVARPQRCATAVRRARGRYAAACSGIWRGADRREERGRRDGSMSAGRGWRPGSCGRIRWCSGRCSHPRAGSCRAAPSMPGRRCCTTGCCGALAGSPADRPVSPVESGRLRPHRRPSDRRRGADGKAGDPGRCADGRRC